MAVVLASSASHVRACSSVHPTAAVAQDPVTCLYVHHSSGLLVIGTCKGSVLLVQSLQGEECSYSATRLCERSEESVRSAFVKRTADVFELLVSCGDWCVRGWDMQKIVVEGTPPSVAEREAVRFARPHGYGICPLSFVAQHETSFLLLAAGQQQSDFLDMSSGKPEQTTGIQFGMPRGTYPTGFTGDRLVWVQSAERSPSKWRGRKHWMWRVALWDWGAREEIRTWEFPTGRGPAWGFQTVPGTDLLFGVLPASPNFATVWDVRSGEMIRELRGHDDKIVAMSLWSKSEKVVGSAELATIAADRTVRRWRMLDGSCTCSIRISGIPCFVLGMPYFLAWTQELCYFSDDDGVFVFEW